jgi:beta-lactamase regulating signal transducer with metallopeptidase domain
MTHINFAMTTLLNGICQGTILAAVMWVLLKLLPRLNSTTRFTVLWLTLLAVVALPTGLVSPSAPTTTGVQRDSLPIATTNKSVATTFAAVEIRHSESKATANSESHPASISESTRESASDRGFESRGFESPLRNLPSRTSSAVMETFEHPLIRIRSGKVFTAIEILWALLSLVMLARLAGGYWEMRRLKAGAMPAPDRWELRLRRLRAINGVRRQTRLLISRQVAGPMSLGFLDPAILIPWAFLDTLSDSELDHIFMHELAHLQRLDDWTNLAQRLIEAVLPIQPAVYWLSHRMSLEREMACDDWVIAATGTAKPYAASLTKVAELSQFGPAGILAAGAAGSQSQLLRRVHHMLDRTRNAAPKLVLGPLLAAVAAVVGLIYLGARAPQMVALAQSPANENNQQLPVTTASRAPHALHGPVAPIAALNPTSVAMLASSASPAAQAPTSPLAPPAPLAPSAPLSPMAPLAPLAPVASQQSSETHMEFKTRDGWTSLTVKIDGAIEFTDDDHDVKSLSPNGHFKLEEGSWFSGSTYDVKADATGNLTKTYSVGRTSKPLDDEGRAWLGRLLPQVIRDTGMGAERRVARILRQGGPPAVIAEIGLIHSDGSRRIYLEQLFSQATLNTEQLKESAKLIRGISSDGDKAQVLITVDEKYFAGNLRPYLFDAAESISSDGDKRRVLSDIVKKDAGNTESLVRAARAAGHISSDGDKAEVLVEIADPYHASDELHMVYFEAVNSISSDGDHARVLSKVLQAHGDDSDTLARVLRSAERISSDGDKARVLKEAASSYRDDQATRKAFFDAANSISSDGDHQQVLVTLVHRQGIGTDTLAGIANSAQRISSDGDKARVLVDLAGANIEPARDAFFAAADSIHSDGDRSRVLTTLLDKPGTSSAMAIAAIQSATGISSEGDMARVLLDAANRYSNDPTVNAALGKAAQSLHSDGEYRAVMSEIERHRGNI